MNYDSKMVPAADNPGPIQRMGQNRSAKTADHVPLSNEEHSMVDAHSIRAREAARVQLRADIDAFLAEGGKVTTLAANQRADLPRAPQNNYGKGSI